MAGSVAQSRLPRGHLDARCLQGQPGTVRTVEATWHSGAGTVVMSGCLGWPAEPTTPQVGAQARWLAASQHVRDSPEVGFGERPEEGRVLRLW